MSAKFERTQKNHKYSTWVWHNWIKFCSIVNVFGIARGWTSKVNTQNSKIVFTKFDPVSCFVIGLPSAKEKFLISSIAKESKAKPIATKQKQEVCSYKLSHDKFGVKSGLGGSPSNATKGKLAIQHAATRSAMKSVSTDQNPASHFRRFMKSITFTSFQNLSK